MADTMLLFVSLSVYCKFYCLFPHCMDKDILIALLLMTNAHQESLKVLNNYLLNE